MPEEEYKILGMFKFNPKLVVIVALALPAIYIWMDLDWNKIIPIVAAFVGVVVLNDAFVSKSEVRTVKGEPVGPTEAYKPQGSDRWEYGMDKNGEIVPQKKAQPPNYQRV